MLSKEDLVLDFCNYLKKMSKLIEKEAVLSLFSIKLVETRRLNDIYCCIAASWPEVYKKYVHSHGPLSLKSPMLYNKLKEATLNKFFLSADLCVVHYDKAIQTILSLKSAIKKDLSFILANNQDQD